MNAIFLSTRVLVELVRFMLSQLDEGAAAFHSFAYSFAAEIYLLAAVIHLLGLVVAAIAVRGQLIWCVLGPRRYGRGSIACISLWPYTI